MTFRILIGLLILSTLGLLFMMKGPSVNPQLPFHVFPFKDFNVEGQSFLPGLGSENFQIEVPQNEKLDQISLDQESLKRESIQLAGYGVGTSYVTVPIKNGFYLFQGSGASFFSSDGLTKNWHISLSDMKSDLSLSGQVYSMPDGYAVAFILQITPEDGKILSEIKALRFSPENGTNEVLLSLPEQSPIGYLTLFYLQNGFISTRVSNPWVEGDPAQFYDLDGKPAPHPLATALNLLHRHKIDLSSPDGLPGYGAFYPSQTKDPWGLFPWDSMPGHLDKRLFLLSVTDTVQAVPVTCERYSLEPQESLTFILVNPKLNLFLLGARLHQNDDSIMMYLGRVRKDSTGKVYRTETFRVKYFPEVERPIFSRNGQVLLFAMRDGHETNLVFAHLTDIVADVNRRYPDAKFDLEELK